MNTVEVWDEEAHKRWDDWAQVALDDVFNQLDANLLKQLTREQTAKLVKIAVLFQQFKDDIELNHQQG